MFYHHPSSCTSIRRSEAPLPNPIHRLSSPAPTWGNMTSFPERLTDEGLLHRRTDAVGWCLLCSPNNHSHSLWSRPFDVGLSYTRAESVTDRLLSLIPCHYPRHMPIRFSFIIVRATC
ncbi:hypothetical protein C356_03157 [Cryptococcus neoformans c45]|nr:hypothetical protein C356_03157 [Cryptococcus neoformans var. grubii c45]